MWLGLFGTTTTSTNHAFGCVLENPIGVPPDGRFIVGAQTCAIAWLQQLTFRLAHHSGITVKALRLGAATACAICWERLRLL